MCPGRVSNTRHNAASKTVTDRRDLWLAGRASTWCSSCQLAGSTVAIFHVLFLWGEKVSNLSDILTPNSHLQARMVWTASSAFLCEDAVSEQRVPKQTRRRLGVLELNGKDALLNQYDAKTEFRYGTWRLQVLYISEVHVLITRNANHGTRSFLGS
jgi:hypothetical protein